MSALFSILFNYLNMNRRSTVGQKLCRGHKNRNKRFLTHHYFEIWYKYHIHFIYIQYTYKISRKVRDLFSQWWKVSNEELFRVDGGRGGIGDDLHEWGVLTHESCKERACG